MPSRNLELFLIGRDLSASKAMAHLGKETEKTAGIGSKFGKAFKVGALAAAGATVAAGAAVIHLADKFESAHVRLETAIKNTGNSAEEMKGKISASDKAMARLGYNATETESALAILTTATKSPTKALDDMQVVADLARYKNLSLAESATIVARANAGQLRGIKQLGIDLPIAAGGAVKVQAAQAKLADAQKHYNQLLEVDHQKKKLTLADHLALQNASDKVRRAQEKVNAAEKAGGDIVAELGKAVKGQAAAATDTLSGKLEVLKAKAENFGIKVGLVAIPALLKFIGYLGDGAKASENAAKWIGKHKIEAEVLAGVLTVALLPALGRLVVAFALNAYAKFASGLYIAASKADALVAAINPVTAAVAIAAAAVTYGYLEWRKYNNAANDAIDTAKRATTFDAMTAPLAKLQTQTEKTSRSWNIFKAAAAENAYQKTTDALDAVNLNVGMLRSTLGVTSNAAVMFAQAAGVDLTTAMGDSAQAVADWASKNLFANSTQREFADTTVLVAQYVNNAKDKTNAYADALDHLASLGENAVMAEVDFKQSVSDATKHLKTGSKSLSDNTDAGRMNIEMLKRALDAAKQHSKAVYTQKLTIEDSGKATLDAKADLDQHIKALEGDAKKAGVSKGAIDRLLVSFGLIPPKKVTKFSAPGLSAVDQQVRNLYADLKNVSSRTWIARVVYDVTGKGPAPPVANAPSGLGGLLNPSNIRAGGGDVAPFQTYLVGERRPELLVMGSRGGHVYPSVPTHGGGNVYNLSFPNYLGNIDTVVKAVMAEARRQTKNGASLGVVTR